MHFLSWGHSDCVGLIINGCHFCEFKVLDHSVHSQIFSVAVLRRETPKIVQSGGYLGNHRKKSSDNS